LNAPVVSVIVPCYNYAQYIGDCLESLLAQTFQDWECIVINDGSTDNSVEIIKQYCNKDSRIICLTQTNSGPTVARNFGLKHSQGEYIQFLDADDKIEFNKFEIQVQLFEIHENVDLVYSEAKFFNNVHPEKLHDNLDLISKSELKTISGGGDELIQALLKENIMVISSPLTKKKVFTDFGGMDTDLYYYEDWELWARLAINNCVFLYDNTENSRALVRVHDSYSKNEFKMNLNALIASTKLINSIQERKYKKILAPKIAYYKKMIDEHLIRLLRNNLSEAKEKTMDTKNKVMALRYKLYLFMYGNFPNAMVLAFSRLIHVFSKVKNMVIYA
jgi:glycosyltransferase involved in cell wall biosynthesis